MNIQPHLEALSTHAAMLEARVEKQAQEILAGGEPEDSARAEFAKGLLTRARSLREAVCECLAEFAKPEPAPAPVEELPGSAREWNEPEEDEETTPEPSE